MSQMDRHLSPLRRLPAAAVFAVVAILVASSVALGASLITIAPSTPAQPATAPTETAKPSAAAATAVPSVTPTEAPTAPGHTHRPAPQPTSNPLPPVTDLGPLSGADNPDGSLTFTWSACSSPDARSLVLVREFTSSGKTPDFLSGSAAWAETDPAATSANVASVGPGDYQVRLQAIGDADGVPYLVAQTATLHVHLSAGHGAADPTPAAPAPTTQPTHGPLPPVEAMGALGATDNIDATLTFSWTPYSGDGVETYKLVYELTSSGRTPNFLGGSHSWASVDPARTSVTVSGIGPGDYQVRLQAIGHVAGSAHVLGETATLHVHLSAAHPVPSATPAPSAVTTPGAPGSGDLG
jgi:hypothetical protein